MIKVNANFNRIKGYNSLKSLENNDSDEYRQYHRICRFVFNLQSVSFIATFDEDTCHFSESISQVILKVRCEGARVTFHETAYCLPVVEEIIFEEIDDKQLRVKLGNYADIECYRIFARVEKFDIQRMPWHMLIVR